MRDRNRTTAATSRAASAPFVATAAVLLAVLPMLAAGAAQPAGAAGAATAAAGGGSEAMLLLALGLGAAAVFLFILELVIPSAGMLALLCAACAIASVVAMFLYDSTLGVVTMLAYIVAAPFGVAFGFRMLRRTSLGRRLILDPEDPDLSDDERTALSERERRERVERVRALIGRDGVALTPLRPIGVVRIDGERVDAMAEGDMIDAGARIEVVDAYDNQLKVRAAAD